jgi:hypothetical protein
MFKTPDWKFHLEDDEPYIREYTAEYLGKDFSVLEDFTDEELAEELCRRTSLGKELG